MYDKEAAAEKPRRPFSKTAAKERVFMSDHVHIHADGTTHSHTHSHAHTKAVLNRLSRAQGH